MEDDDWLNSFTDEPEPTPEPVAAAETATTKQTAVATTKPGDGAKQDADNAESDLHLDIKDPNYPKKPVYNKIWIRPKYLQYNYMYKYRTNYYDDIIEYLDKRDRGYEMEFPKPQTWPERVLRTFVKRGTSVEAMRQMLQDVKVRKEYSKRSGFFHTSHAKDYYCRKYKIVI